LVAGVRIHLVDRQVTLGDVTAPVVTLRLHGETRIGHGNSLLDCRRGGVYRESAEFPARETS
jgi:hypothetical protein